jgi:hypothetical protein
MRNGVGGASRPFGDAKAENAFAAGFQLCDRSVIA